MSIDPYHAVQQEIQSSLQAATQLRSSYVRIRAMARDDSEELMWAKNELKATLAALEADLEDLEESVKIVESTDARMFGLDDSEVANRRKYVIHVRKEIDNMRAEVNTPTQPAALASGSTTPAYTASPPRGRRSEVSSPFQDRPDDDQTAWAREEQQMMMRDQDRTMDSIAGTLNTLAQQASLMGQEIGEHNEMLTDIERGVDQTENKLGSAMKKMRKFIRDSEERGSGWCIIILIIVLCILLLAIILI